MRKRVLVCSSVVVLLVIGGILIYMSIFANSGYTPPNGFVPDEVSAIRIAEAIWLPIYGDEIYDKLPFTANYNSLKGYWEVTGTLPDDMHGGVPEAHIRKRDGKILFVSHGM